MCAADDTYVLTSSRCPDCDQFLWHPWKAMGEHVCIGCRAVVQMTCTVIPDDEWIAALAEAVQRPRGIRRRLEAPIFADAETMTEVLAALS